MRRSQLLGLAVGVLFAAPAAAAPIQVVYRVDTSAGSWRPIRLSDVGKVVENAALEELTRSGHLRLQRAKRGGGAADYRLRIDSHVLDEAETHTVSLALTPDRDPHLPSLSAARTVTLSKLSRGKMLDRIEASAREAAKALSKSLERPLERREKNQSPHFEVDEPFDTKVKPWQWAPVRVPAGSPGKAAKQLYARNNKKRQAALRELASLALVETSPRQALERCVLDHPREQMRLGCLEALRPISRRHQPTARVVVEVFRRDPDRRVVREANDQMVYFVGPAKQAALQAWMESAAEGKDSGPLKDLGDLPNLDLTIRQCMENTGKHRSRENRPRFRCIELLEPLPHARRRAILWRFIREMDPGSPYYLNGAGEREGSTGTPWNRALDALLEDIPSWDPKLEEILWARYQRTLSAAAMDRLCGWGAPSEKLVGRMLEIMQTRGEFRALNGLLRVAKLDSSHAPRIKSAIEEMLALGTFHKDLGERRLKDALRRLDKEAKR